MAKGSAVADLRLWPGLLPLHEARWARSSSLEVIDGVLQVHHGRRRSTFAVPGGRLHPLESLRNLRVSCRYVLVDADGSATATIDLAEWVPGGAQAVGRHTGQGLQPPFPAVRDALAEALSARPSSTPWTGDAAAAVSPVDVVARRFHQGVLLVLLGLAVGSLGTGVPWMVLVGGIASVGLVLLGLSPVRRWSPRRARWSERSRHLGDEVGLDADQDVVRLLDIASGRAGCVPIGRDRHQLATVHAVTGGLRLMLPGGVPVIELRREAWGSEAWERLRGHLASIPDLAIWDRKEPAAWLDAPRLVSTAAMPATVGGDLVVAAVMAACAGLAAITSDVAALLYAASSVTAVVLAAERAIVRARSPSRAATP